MDGGNTVEFANAFTREMFWLYGTYIQNVGVYYINVQCGCVLGVSHTYIHVCTMIHMYTVWAC